MQLPERSDESALSGDLLLARVEAMDVEEVRPRGFPSGGAVAELAFTAVALMFLVYTFLTSGPAMLPALVQRAFHLAFVIALSCFIYPSGFFRKARALEAAFNVLLMVAASLSIIYFSYHWRRLYISGLTPFDRVLGVLVVLIVLDATRRSIGLPMVAIVVLGVMYAVSGPALPPAISHRGYTLRNILNQVVVGTEGLFSSTLGIASTYVVLFVFFASFLEAFGGLRAFMRLALAIAGGLVGGAAKVAVVASSFFAMISGSTVANVVSTGSITIPLMKRLGYPAAWAGAVEAVASTGGTFTPPIMGATAFILAEFMGIPYLDVVKAAAIPAFLYYVGLYAAVHQQSCRQGFVGLPREKLPSLRESLIEGAHLLVPLVLLVVLLVKRYTETTAALYSTLCLFICAAARKSTRPTLAQVARASKNAARAMVAVSSACATAGVVVALLNLTGVSFKLSSIIVALSRGRLLAALLLTEAAAVLLGMGLVTPAVYTILAVLVVPGLVRLGVGALQAHMFTFFVAALAPITPPVALAAFAAAGLAGENPVRVGVNAVKLGLVAFFLPYFFVMNPTLLGHGSPARVLFDVGTACVGALVLGTATQGYFYRVLKPWEQCVFLALGLMLAVPSYTATLVGLIGLVLCSVLFRRRFGRDAASLGHTR